jgi:hypothetical protein
MVRSADLKKTAAAKADLRQVNVVTEERTSTLVASRKRAFAPKVETALKGQRSGFVPEGDVRLTANIRGDLHLKLKIRAAQERTTIGELIEQWVEGWE